MGQETDGKPTGTKLPEQGDWNLLSGLIWEFVLDQPKLPTPPVNPDRDQSEHWRTAATVLSVSFIGSSAGMFFNFPL
jgi:hypothetical protein